MVLFSSVIMAQTYLVAGDQTRGEECRKLTALVDKTQMKKWFRWL
jgi:hypothetical protein